MGLNFPNTPTVNQKFPASPIAGVPTYTWDGEKWTTNGGSIAGKTAVWTDGSTPMVAQLTLVAPPVNATDAAAKSYVDTKVANVDLSSKVSKAGDTMTGDLNVNGELRTSNSLTLKYAGPAGGLIYFGSASKSLIYDGTNFALIGGTMVLPADPAAPMQAVTKQYADALVPPSFPAGTVMVFYQAAAPTGWTKLATQNDKALRVVSGSGGVAGGTNAFSTVMAQTVTGNTTLTAAATPPHTHSGNTGTVSADHTHGGVLNGSGLASNYPTVGSTQQYGNPGSTGGIAVNHTHAFTSDSGAGVFGGAHSHPITMAIQYIDVILASKN